MRPSTTSRRPGWLSLLLTALQFTTVLAQDAASTDFTIPATGAASSSPPPTTVQSSIATCSAGSQTHTIQVGLLDHKMRPQTTEAAVGEIIEFEFYPLNHSIVRAEYGFPCIPYEMTGSGKTGFFSGFNPVDKVLDNPPKYSSRINDTEPIFFYCSAPGSCITYGMVGGINLNSNMSIDKQRTLAMDSAYMLQPGEPFPAESPLPSGNPASSIPPSSSISSSSTPPAGASHSSGGPSIGTIIGIVVAAVSALFFGALLFFCWGRTKSLREVIERKDGTVRHVSACSNQMAEYKQPNVAHHAHNSSQMGFRSPLHPAVHPGSHPGGPDPGTYGYQHDEIVGGAGYFTANYPAKYTSPTATHPAYHTVLPGSPPPSAMNLDGHTFMHQGIYDASSRGGGTSAPRNHEAIPSDQPQMQERAVEMEAITTLNQTDECEANRTSKL